MATKCVLNKSTLTGIADAIRAKGGTTETMKPGEMAAKIEAIPSGGDGLFASYITKTITNFNAAEILGYDATTPAINVGQHFFNGFSSLETIYAPMISPNAFFAQNCTSLTSATVRAVSNRADLFNGCSSLVELTIKELNASQIIGWTNFLSGINISCVIHCLDKDIKYVDGAWTIVERS